MRSLADDRDKFTERPSVDGCKVLRLRKTVPPPGELLPRNSNQDAKRQRTHLCLGTSSAPPAFLPSFFLKLYFHCCCTITLSSPSLHLSFNASPSIPPGCLMDDALVQAVSIHRPTTAPEKRSHAILDLGPLKRPHNPLFLPGSLVDE
mmetsp:Transcript_35108/g.62581  ORF Transcript_35108/g.62581 Transcript_35108/m.62581 type:complete len:148 (-) Transcript_35108:159-602(-)